MTAQARDGSISDPQTPADWYLVGRNLLRTARTRWKVLAGFVLLGSMMAGIVAFFLPSYYRANAAFQAEAGQSAQLTGGLAGLASQISNLPLGSQSNAQFFADLLTTDDVLRRVAGTTFRVEQTSVPLPTIYAFNRQSEPLRTYNTVRKLRKALSVDVNIRTGVVRFSVEARTAELAQALAETVLVALNGANIELRQGRAAAERAFTSGRAKAAREDLDSAEQTLAAFYQQNRVITNSPNLQMQEAKLKRAVDMAQQLYVQLRIQEEQAAIQEVRNTPALSVIDPPLLPVKRSWPKRARSVALGGLLGFVIALALIHSRK